MAFPAGLKVEIEWVAGTWTDVTADLDSSVQAQIHYGRTDTTQQPSAATLSLRLNNKLGKYTPLRQLLADGVTAHPYYPNVQPRKRIQVSYTISAVKYPRFIGYIKGFPPSLENGVLAYVDIVATCLMDQLSRVTFQQSITEELLVDDPAYLWPMTDAVGATGALEAQGGPQLALFSGTPVFGSFGVGGSATLQGAAGTGVQFTTNQFLNGSIPPLSLPYSAEIFVNFTALPSNFVEIFAAAVMNLSVNFTGGVTWGGGTSSIGVTAGGWHHLAFTAAADGSGVVYVDGVSGGTCVAGTLSGQTFGPVSVGDTAGFSLGGLPMNTSFAAIYPTQLSATRIAAHAASGIGYFGDLTGARIARILTVAGLTSAMWNLDAGQAVVNTYSAAGQTALGICQDMATTEGGDAVFYATPDGKGRFADRTYRKPTTPVVTINATNDLSAATYQPAFDEQNLQNQAIVSRSSASGVDSTQLAQNLPSIAEYGLASLPLTSYATTDADALNNGQYVVGENGFPGFRYPQVGINLLTAINALYVQVATVQIGDRLRLTAIPAGVSPSTQADVIVEGWTETFGTSSYMWVADTSPADNPARMVWNDATYGRWQTSGSTLTSNITAAATSLSITTTGAGNPTITTAAGDYPVNIQIGEEVITLNTAPGGSTSPQAFTGVTRGVLGTPAAAQTAASTVSGYPGTGWAL